MAEDIFTTARLARGPSQQVLAIQEAIDTRRWRLTEILALEDRDPVRMHALEYLGGRVLDADTGQLLQMASTPQWLVRLASIDGLDYRHKTGMRGGNQRQIRTLRRAVVTGAVHEEAFEVWQTFRRVQVVPAVTAISILYQKGWELSPHPWMERHTPRARLRARVVETSEYAWRADGEDGQAGREAPDLKRPEWERDDRGVMACCPTAWRQRLDEDGSDALCGVPGWPAKPGAKKPDGGQVAVVTLPDPAMIERMVQERLEAALQAKSRR